MDKRFMLMALVLGFTTLSAQDTTEAENNNNEAAQTEQDVAANDSEASAAE